MPKKGRLIGSILCGVGTLTFIGAIIAVTMVAEHFAPTLLAAFGDSGRNYTKVNYAGVDPNYYKSDYTNETDLRKHENQLALDISREGMTLLEKGNIPYAKQTKLSLFSESSVNFIFGGTGSGTASSDLDLKSAFEGDGFEVNPKLWDFYKNGKGKGFRRGIGSINYGDSDDYAINEAPLSLIQSDSNVVSSFKEYDTAVYVLSRTGGEGNDLARGMDDYVDTDKDKAKGMHPDAEGDKKKSYLEPDSIELQIIDYLNKNFKDVILVVNSNNPMELGWVKNYDKVKTVINVPGTGENGLQALPQILNGDVTASGKLADTYAYDAFSSPAMMNMGDFEFLSDGKKIPNLTGTSWADGYFYVTYNEGIYVGYRYYETRYEDVVLGQGNAASLADWEVGASKASGSSTWDYAKEVQYPFGYGDSTSSFKWSNFNVTEQGNDFVATIDVENIGNVAGKDVVELYAQTPYGDYEKANGIQKSAVQLVAFGKTKELKQGENETVTLSFSQDDLKSYDSKAAKGYILSKGQYYFTAGKDAHAAVNNILKAKGADESKMIASPSETTPGDSTLVSTIFNVADTDTTKFQKDSETGVTVTNQFGFADLSTYDSTNTYLSRDSWNTTYPKTYGEVSSTPSIHSERINGTNSNGQPEGYMYTKELSKDNEIYKLMTSFNSLNPNTDSSKIEQRYQYNQNIDLDLVDLRGRSYDDPLWEKLMSKMSLAEVAQLVQNGGYKTDSIPSINKPYVSDKDGPAGFNSVSGHFSLGFTYPCTLMIAQTWNKDLALAKGDAIGEDGLHIDVTGWYGPGNNIHRTPFAGRNFEYYSEDPTISSFMAREEVIGAAKKGVFAYVKHFALNDQEINREKDSGISTFSNEQTIREIYLKAFEGVIKGNEIDETFYEVKTDDQGNVVKKSNGDPELTKKTEKIRAATGVMSSFNRVGPVWAGGCYPLLTGVLRNEWGFDGAVVTDYYHNWFMNTKQAVEAGGSLSLDPEQFKFEIGEDDYALQHYAHEAAKSILYTVANSNALNGYIHGTKELPAWPVYKTLVIIVDVILGVFAWTCLFFTVWLALPKKEKNNKKEEK